jgi:hypothetical protein
MKQMDWEQERQRLAAHCAATEDGELQEIANAFFRQQRLRKRGYELGCQSCARIQRPKKRQQ